MENWREISVNQFKKIRKVMEENKHNPEDYSTLLSLASILSGKSEEEILNTPLAEVQPYFSQVWELDTPPKRSRLKKNYKVGEWELTVTDATKLNVAQWIDFQTFSKDFFGNMIQLLSVVLVPKGKNYNEDYDMSELQSALGEMKIPDAMAVCFFFQKRWLKSMRTTLTFLVGMGYRKKNKELMQRAIAVRKEVSVLLSSL